MFGLLYFLFSIVFFPRFDVHVASKGKMVPFCGYYLPVQYTEGLSVSHNHTRTDASLFDVSHMGQVRILGEQRVAFFETLCVTDIAGLRPNFAKLTVLTNEEGGVKDDCMVTVRDNHLFVVLNAGCKDKDMAHILEHAAKWNASHPSQDPIRMEYLTDRSLLALQGPKAASVLATLLPESFDFVHFGFMNVADSTIQDMPVSITRCGYTGEDGFEISCEDAHVEKLWSLLTSHENVLPAGLGVRDSLRLEAGLCLYGHELNENVSPIEAGLGWTISPRRKREGGFIGSDIILSQLANGSVRKLVGLEVKSGPPAREGALVLDQDGNDIGIVTSGGPAPSLKMKKIALAYVKSDVSSVGTQIQVSTRGKAAPAEIVSLPFVPAQYYRAPKKEAAKQ